MAALPSADLGGEGKYVILYMGGGVRIKDALVHLVKLVHFKVEMHYTSHATAWLAAA
jgi:hypothetical protein